MATNALATELGATEIPLSYVISQDTEANWNITASQSCFHKTDHTMYHMANCELNTRQALSVQAVISRCSSALLAKHLM